MWGILQTLLEGSDVLFDELSIENDEVVKSVIHVKGTINLEEGLDRLSRKNHSRR